MDLEIDDKLVPCPFQTGGGGYGGLKGASGGPCVAQADPDSIPTRWQPTPTTRTPSVWLSQPNADDNSVGSLEMLAGNFFLTLCISILTRIAFFVTTLYSRRPLMVCGKLVVPTYVFDTTHTSQLKTRNTTWKNFIFIGFGNASVITVLLDDLSLVYSIINPFLTGRPGGSVDYPRSSRHA